MSKKKSGKNKSAPMQLATRGYREVASVGGGINADWPVSYISEDSDLWQNAWALTSRVRDLFRSNPLYQSYRETLWANVFGSDGLLLRMRVKETEDRVIHTPREKAAIQREEDRRNRVFEYVASRDGLEFKRRAFLHITGNNGNRVAQVKVGDPDVFANVLIEEKWKEWQRKEFCDVRQTRNYGTIRQLRLISAVRDGDFFIRMVRGKSVNKFGFALQMVNAEWVDRWFNTTLPNGNQVRMGIEYQFTAWGLGKVVAYYFIKRQPDDWMFSIPGAFNFSSGTMHDRVPAEEIIHYFRAVDADGTRPAPWVASTIPSSRQLDQAMLAEVVAWRAAACKTGWLYSDIVPEGGASGLDIDPRSGLPKQPLTPGDIAALPYGVKFQPNDPTHPNANVEEFRKAEVRQIAAGMVGADYSTLANDYEAINYSAGRLQSSGTNEKFKMLQQFDIDYAENVIFENWLDMALTFGAIPLPLAKLDKFNRKVFQGHRWGGVDEVKDATAGALRVANKFSSRTRECAAEGLDFEEVLFELAEEEMLIESFGMTSVTTVETPGVASQTSNGDAQSSDSADAAEVSTSTPKKKMRRKALAENRLIT